MTAEPTPAPGLDREPGRTPPLWLIELVDVLALRRAVVWSVAGGLSVLGIGVALLFPGVLPARPLTGSAVGIAAALLAVAGAIAVDAADRTVRGPRHVRATGAGIAAILTEDAPVEDLLAWARAQLAANDRLRVAFAAPGPTSLGSSRVAGHVGLELARTGHRVLLVDLTRPSVDEPGVAEVVSGEVSLGQAVTFDAAVSLARLGAGRDQAAALAAFPELASRLPADVEALLVALPGLRQPDALHAAWGARRTLLLVAPEKTQRVDLIAALDALDRAHAPAEVVVLPFQPRGGRGEDTGRTAPPPPPPPPPDDPRGWDPAPQPASRPVTVPDAPAEPDPAPPYATDTAPLVGVAPAPPVPEPAPAAAPVASVPLASVGQLVLDVDREADLLEDEAAIAAADEVIDLGIVEQETEELPPVAERVPATDDGFQLRAEQPALGDADPREDLQRVAILAALHHELTLRQGA